MLTHQPRKESQDSGHGTESALDALLVAESVAERALDEADAKAERLLTEARDRASTIEREAVEALARDLEQQAAENAARLEQMTRAVVDAANRRIAYLRELPDDEIERLAALVVARLTELPL
jgi:vacuolar-type H+-ATPase subunit H